MVRAQVFSSLCPQGWSCPSTPIYTKSLLVLRLIAPSTLEIPALPTLSLFVPDEFKHALVGWGQIFLYNYTCLIKLKPPSPNHRSRLKFCYWVWSFAGASCTSIQVKLNSPWWRVFIDPTSIRQYLQSWDVQLTEKFKEVLQAFKYLHVSFSLLQFAQWDFE